MKKSVVALAQARDIKKSLGKALGYLPLEKLIKGKRVVVKPNDTWASQSDKTAVTQPEVLDKVLDEIEKFYPKELIVVGGSGSKKSWQVFEISGLSDVIKNKGVQFIDLNQPPYLTHQLPFGPQEEIKVNQFVRGIALPADRQEVLVSLAQLKLHEQVKVSLAIKNVAMGLPSAEHYGYPRATRLRLHRKSEDLHSFIAAMAVKFPIDLAIIVGEPAMLGKGPIGGETFHTGLAIASLDPVAADTIGASLLGFSLKDLPYLTLAQKHNKKGWTADLNQIKIRGLSLEKAKELFEKARTSRT